MDSPYLPPGSFPFKPPPWGGRTNSLHRWLFQRTPLKKSTHRKRKNFFPPLPSLLRFVFFRRGGSPQKAVEAAKEISLVKREVELLAGEKISRSTGGRRGEKSENFSTVSFSRSRESARKEIGTKQNFCRGFPPRAKTWRRDFILPGQSPSSSYDLMGLVFRLFPFRRQLG